MKFHASLVLIASLIVLTGTTVTTAQEVKGKTPPLIFQEARDLINGGSLEVAADLLKDFAAANPTPQDYLDIEAKYGPTTFLKLRTIPRWYDESSRNKAFLKDTLEKIVAASIAANESLLKDPKRIQKFVRNLAGIQEEYAFAVQELKRSGDAVVPYIIESLRLDTNPDQRSGVLRAIIELGPETVPGFLVAAESMADEFKLMLVQAISRRPDFLVLSTAADSNLIPFLWYLSALPKDSPNPLRTVAVDKLKELYAAAYDRRNAEDELTRAARPLYERKARFHNFDSARSRVKLWTWDSVTLNVKAINVLTSVAEETIGLQYLRWALDRNAKYEPALDHFLAFATERAVERAKFTDIAVTDPAAFKLLAVAPTTTLIRLLEQALTENRTALALGLVQALGDRAEVAAGTMEIKPGGGDRPAVLVKALDYADPRVQLAAALALLKIPNAKHGANARIVDILKRAISTDTGAAGVKGKAIVADGSAVRGDQIANLLRGIGYQAEVVGNGRQLAQRIDRTSDFDVVLIDRHIVDPTLEDLIPMLRGDSNTARRPVMVVASPDARAQLGLETLLARLASLIAATETVDPEIPPIPEADRRKAIDEIQRDRKIVIDRRDKALRSFYEVRLARLERIVKSANLKETPDLKRRLDLRLAQLVMGTIVAEYDLTPTSAPKFVRDFEQLTELLRRQTDLDASVEGVYTLGLVKLVQQLEQVLTPELKTKFDAVRARMDSETLALAKEQVIDPATQQALFRLTRAYPGVTVIREPYSKVGFEEDMAAAIADPAQRPRDPGEKAAAAKSAIEALKKLATGEIPGYDLAPATDNLRAALASDVLGIPAAEALARLASPTGQTDLVMLAANGTRTANIRKVAADAAVRNIQAYGKLASAEAVNAIVKASGTGLLASELAIVKELLSPGPLAEVMKNYVPTTGGAKTEAPAEPKTEDKKEN
ncbi:hypothetical protein BH11PLA2_BH11PLA2_19370 [soil metagenome]